MSEKMKMFQRKCFTSDYSEPLTLIKTVREEKR